MAFLTRTTFDYRCRLMRRMMDANALDALAFLSSDFFQWATNFHVDVQTWERPIAVVAPREGEAFAIMNELSTHHLRGTLAAPARTRRRAHRRGIRERPAGAGGRAAAGPRTGAVLA